MLKATLSLAALLLLVSGCCFNHIDRELFERSSLEAKIDRYETAIRQRCVRGDMLQLLHRIARHGMPAADAMTALMKAPRPDFPLEHVMTVFAFTRFEGVNVHEHPGFVELHRLADSHPDAAIRAAAQQSLADIEKYPAPVSPPQ